MKRFGVLLALLVFGSLLMVGTGTVKAGTIVRTYDFTTIVQGTEMDSASVSAGNWYNTTHFRVWVWNKYGTVTIKHDDTQNALLLQEYTGAGYATSVIYLYNENISYVANMTLNFTVTASGKPTNWGYAVGAVVVTKQGAKYTVYHYTGAYFNTDQLGNVYKINDLPDPTAGVLHFAFDPVADLHTQGISIDPNDVDHVQIVFGTDVSNSGTVKLYVYRVDVGLPAGGVTFSLKDALTSQPLQGVTVKEGNSTLGTVDDGGSLELTKGTHTLTFEKQGYWSTTKTIDVQDDMSVSVELYPDSASVMIKDLKEPLQFYEHSTGEFSFTLSPIDTSATYDAYLSFTGLNNIVEVDKNGNAVSPENGRYYLGDITGDTAVTVKFKTGSVGTYAFSMTIQSSDGAGAKTYTTTKQVSYKINPLPFSVSFPSEWQVGANQLRVSEASGQSYSMVVVLKDSSGATAWSDSYSFTPYEVHTFTVQVPKEGSYTLEFQWNGMVAEYSVSVGSGIKLLTTSVTAKKGDVVGVQLSIKNSNVNTHYYTVELSGGFLDAPVNQTIAVPPASEKTVSVPVQVPSKLQFDAYDLNVQVKEGDDVKYQGTVHFIIQGSAGFSLFGGGSGGFGGSNLLLIGGLGLAGLMGVALISRRR